MEYKVSYGSAFAVDQFGFVGKGKILFHDETLKLVGNKKWPVFPRICIFLAITILPWLIFHLSLGFLLALILIHFLCRSNSMITLDSSSLSNIKKSGKRISFKASIMGQAKIRKTLFIAFNEDGAQAIEGDLLKLAQVGSKG